MADTEQEKVTEQQELYTIPQFCSVEKAYTPGGVRWKIFNQADELEASGALVRDGRRVLLHRRKFIEHVCGRKRAAA